MVRGVLNSEASYCFVEQKVHAQQKQSRARAWAASLLACHSGGWPNTTSLAALHARHSGSYLGDQVDSHDLTASIKWSSLVSLTLVSCNLVQFAVCTPSRRGKCWWHRFVVCVLDDSESIDNNL